MLWWWWWRLRGMQQSWVFTIWMEWFLKCLKQYADFKGRARRKEFWMFMSFYFPVSTSAVFWALLWVDGFFVYHYKGVIAISCTFAFAMPAISVTIRRLHDIGKSGWWFLIQCVPLIGHIWLLTLVCVNSQPGKNKYGVNPKE